MNAEPNNEQDQDERQENQAEVHGVGPKERGDQLVFPIMWSKAKPSRTTAMKTTNPATPVITGSMRLEAVNFFEPPFAYGRRICAAKIAANRTSTRTNPPVIAAYCEPSSFTSCSVGGGAGAVSVTVTVGAGVGSAVTVTVGAGEGSEVGAGDGDGEIVTDFRTGFDPDSVLTL
jgi:hypothetical protein